METNCFREILPKKFEYVILESYFESREKFTCTLRVKISNGDDLFEWLRLFEKLTNTNWNARSSKVDSAQFSVARDFVCHHSSFNKLTVEKDHDKSKNKTCGAKLSIRIKWNNKNVRYRDKYIKEGYLGIIRINSIHSHAVNSSESLRWLRRAPEIKEKFQELFDMGLTPAEAIRFHEYQISKNHSKEMTNRRVNPPRRWVYAFHNKWLLKNKKNSFPFSSKSNHQKVEEDWKCVSKDEKISIFDDDSAELTDEEPNSVCSSTSSMQTEESNFMIGNTYRAEIEDEPTNISGNELTSERNVVHLIYVKEDCTVDKNKKYCKILSKDEAPSNITSSAQIVDAFSIVASTSGAEIKEDTTETSCDSASVRIGMEPSIIPDDTFSAQIELLSDFQIELDRIVGLLKGNINDKHLYNLAEKYIQKLKSVDTVEQLHSFLVKSILSFRSESNHKVKKQTSFKQKSKSSLTTKVNRQFISPYYKKLKKSDKF